MKKNLLLIFSAFCLLAQQAQASRRYVPMGDRINAAELIVIGQVTKPDRNHLIIKVKQVLKGDEAYENKVINMKKGRSGISIISGEVATPEGENVAFLFEPGWLNSDLTFWPVLESYVDEEIKTLKKLIKLLKIDSERKRIKKLIKWYPKADYPLKKQLLIELKRMTDPENFDLFFQAFQQLKTDDDLYDLMYIVEKTYDVRAVPFFIQALESTSKTVRSDAAHSLFYSYPGADGVAEAFAKHWDDEAISDYSKPYLSARFQHIKYSSGNKAITPWLQAKAYAAAGKHQAARAIYMDYLKEAKNISSQLRYAELLAKDTTTHEQAQMYGYILKNTLKFKPYDTQTVLQLLGIMQRVKWSSEQISDTLLGVLNVRFHDQSIYAHALLLIAESDESLKQQAIKKIVALLETANYGNKTSLLFGLALLAQPDSYKQLLLDFPNYRESHWPLTTVFRTIRQSDDPVAGFIKQLDGLGSGHDSGWPEWLIITMSQYQDERVVSSLLKFLARTSSYELQDTLYQALLNHDHEDESMMRQIVTTLPLTEEWSESTLTRLMISRFGESALPHIRQIIQGQLKGDMGQALSALARLGAVDDLQWFGSFCAYGSSHNKKPSQAHCEALMALKRKHHHDLNGPIIKSDKLTPLD